ncbi:unnamed protein product [Mortierella alpina]
MDPPQFSNPTLNVPETAAATATGRALSTSPTLQLSNPPPAAHANEDSSGSGGDSEDEAPLELPPPTSSPSSRPPSLRLPTRSSTISHIAQSRTVCTDSLHASNNHRRLQTAPLRQA